MSNLKQYVERLERSAPLGRHVLNNVEYTKSLSDHQLPIVNRNAAIVRTRGPTLFVVSQDSGFRTDQLYQGFEDLHERVQEVKRQFTGVDPRKVNYARMNMIHIDGLVDSLDIYIERRFKERQITEGEYKSIIDGTHPRFVNIYAELQKVSDSIAFYRALA